MREQSPVTVNDVVNDIEFELVQGAVSRDELGRALQAVRQYQNKVRTEALTSARHKDDRQALRWQFRLNDMLLTLLQELIAALQALRLQQSRTVPNAGDPPPTEAMGPIPLLSGDAEESSAPEKAYEDWYYQKPSDEVEAARQPEALYLKSEVRASRLPLIGGLITYFKHLFFHLPALFYIQRLAERQVPINRLYGDWILHLYRVNRYQHEQIKHLNAQLAALHSRLAKIEERRSKE